MLVTMMMVMMVRRWKRRGDDGDGWQSIARIDGDE